MRGSSGDVLSLVRCLVLLFITMVAFSKVPRSGADAFSSSGNLLQCELAHKASMRGSLVFAVRDQEAISIWFEDVSSDDEDDSPLACEKVCKVSDDVVLVGTGLMSDFLYIKKLVTDFVLEYHYAFGQDPPVSRISDLIAQKMHENTLYEARRPFAVAIVVAGRDAQQGGQLLLQEINALGSRVDCDAVCVGRTAADVFARWKEATRVQTISSGSATCTAAPSMLGAIRTVIDHTDDNSDDSPSIEDTNEDHQSAFVRKHRLKFLQLLTRPSSKS